MFETAVIRAQAQVAPRRVGMLSASIGIHTFAGAAILIASLHALRFPINAPNQMSKFSADLRPPVSEGRSERRCEAETAAGGAEGARNHYASA